MYLSRIMKTIIFSYLLSWTFCSISNKASYMGELQHGRDTLRHNDMIILFQMTIANIFIIILTKLCGRLAEGLLRS